VWKLISGTSVVQEHGLLMMFAAVLTLVGLQLIAVGLLGELGVWQYFNGSARRPYSISQVLETPAVDGTVNAEQRIRVE
jgi:hypothetical protein